MLHIRVATRQALSCLFGFTGTKPFACLPLPCESTIASCLWVGHSLQSVCILINAASSVFAVPLASHIHGGFIWSNRDRRTLLDKMVNLLRATDVQQAFYFVADAFYARGKVADGLIKRGNHLISRVKSTAVAFAPCPVPEKSLPQFLLSNSDCDTLAKFIFEKQDKNQMEFFRLTG